MIDKCVLYDVVYHRWMDVCILLRMLYIYDIEKKWNKISMMKTSIDYPQKNRKVIMVMGIMYMQNLNPS